jgi:hypothetical protein
MEDLHRLDGYIFLLVGHAFIAAKTIDCRIPFSDYNIGAKCTNRV